MNIDRRTERKLFKDSCYSNENLYIFLSSLDLDNQQIEKFKNEWLSSKNCRYCNKEINIEDFEVTYTYWGARLAGCHNICKINGEKEEALECQILDADCNDCKYFKREKEILNSIPPGFYGLCLKFNKPTAAYAKFFSGKGCFEHRKLS